MDQPDILEKYFLAVRQAPPLMKIERAKVIINDTEVSPTGVYNLLIQKVLIWVLTSVSVVIVGSIGFLISLDSLSEPTPLPEKGAVEIVEEDTDSNFDKKPDEDIMQALSINELPDGNSSKESIIQDRQEDIFYYTTNKWYRFRSVIGSSNKIPVEVEVLINSKKELIYKRNTNLEIQHFDKPTIHFFGNDENITIKVLSDDRTQLTFGNAKFIFIPFVETENVAIDLQDTLFISCGKPGELMPCLWKNVEKNHLIIHSSSMSENSNLLITGLRKETIQLWNNQKLSFGAGGVIVQVPN